MAATEFLRIDNLHAWYGESHVLHGVNLSVGYEFDPEMFACGQSPICAEVNRLVQSGVVVVAAAPVEPVDRACGTTAAAAGSKLHACAAVSCLEEHPGPSAVTVV